MNKITIKNPCTENWNKMKPIVTGKHCSSCNKSVIDIRTKTKEELNFIIETNGSEGLCIRANKSQIRDYQYVKPIKRLAFALLIVFGNALFSISASAQEATQKLKETYLSNQSKETSYTLSGIIIDDIGETLPFAIVNVELAGKIVASDTTDFDGKYTIKLDKSYLNKKVNIHVNYVGFIQERIEVLVNTKEIINNKITLYSHNEIMGDMIIIEEPKKN